MLRRFWLQDPPLGRHGVWSGVLLSPLLHGPRSVGHGHTVFVWAVLLGGKQFSVFIKPLLADSSGVALLVI